MSSVVMLTGSEFFEALLFGQGAWLGLILILGFMFLVSRLSKYSSVIFVPILILLGIEYYNHISGSSNFMWSMVLCFIASIILILDSLTRDS